MVTWGYRANSPNSRVTTRGRVHPAGVCRCEASRCAAHVFIIGPLLDNPHRVGKQLRAPLDDRRSASRGIYRVIYRIDEEHRQVIVVGVLSRTDAYRGR